MAQITIKEICAKTGDSYGEVAGFVKMLERRGLAREVGKRANPEGVRGKPSTIYELDGAFDFVLFEDEISPEPNKLLGEIPMTTDDSLRVLPAVEEVLPTNPIAA